MVKRVGKIFQCKGTDMNEASKTLTAIRFAMLGLALAVAAGADAQEIDWKKVDTTLGRPGNVSGDVHRYGFPRSDLQVTLDGVTIRPALALGGWAAFQP